MEHAAGYERLMNEAQGAWMEEDYEKAAGLFEAAQALAPGDAQAAFYGAVARAMQDGADFRRIADIPAPVERAVAAAAERFGSGAAYYDACRQIASALIDVAALHYGAVTDYAKKERKKRRHGDGDGADALLRDCVLTVGGAAKQTADAILARAEDLSEADEFFWDCLLTLLDNADTYRFSAGLGRDPEIAELEDEIGRLRGNVFGEYAGVEELEDDTGEYAEIVCPHCGETLSFSAEELSGSRTAECPFCGGRIDV